MDYYTSDFHFGHKRIIELCNRPFADVDEMNEGILHSINTTVTPDDHLYLLGDLCMGRMDDTLPLIERIMCPVTIVAGNHDRCHPVNGAKHEKWIERYESLSNVDSVHLGPITIGWMISSDGETRVSGVQACHFPYKNQDNERYPTDKFDPYRAENRGGWLLCGHVHGAWRVHKAQINVGVDAWGGQIPSTDDLLAVMAHWPNDVECLPWTEPFAGTS